MRRRQTSNIKRKALAVVVLVAFGAITAVVFHGCGSSSSSDATITVIGATS